MFRLKGQLTIEYLISFVLFIGLISYVYIMYSSNIPNFIEEVEKEDARAKAYQLSEILINDPGEPINWDTGNVKRIGLSDENFNKTNLVSTLKIGRLKDLCTNYEEMLRKLGIDEPVSIFIFKIDEQTGERTLFLDDFNCQPPTIKVTQIKSKVSRITAYTDDGDVKMAEIVVEVF